MSRALFLLKLDAREKKDLGVKEWILKKKEKEKEKTTIVCSDLKDCAAILP
ncbi:hypothetical protein LguiA_014288 [Lonicera macranthoides]